MCSTVHKYGIVHRYNLKIKKYSQILLHFLLLFLGRVNISENNNTLLTSEKIIQVCSFEYIFAFTANTHNRVI